jgi:hypothetical protein
MKSQIYGRKVGSGETFALLIESSGASTSGKQVDQGMLEEFEVANARRAVQVFRVKGIEGYVQFEGDQTRYEFTPNADFVYPASLH